MSQVTDTYRARTGQGVKAYFAEEEDYTAANWIYIPGTTSLSGPNFTKAELDATHLGSTAKEFLTGLPDPGSLEFAANFDEMNSLHRKFLTETLYQDRYYWVKVVWPTGFTMIFNTQLMSAPLSLGVDAIQTSTFTFRISGKPLTSDTGSAATITWDSTLTGTETTGAVTGSVVGTLVPGSVPTASFLSTLTDGDPFIKGTHYNTSNVPTGLTAVLTKTSNTVATLTFTGTATNKKDVTNVSVTLLDGAFTDTASGAVSGAMKGGIAITFA